MNLRSSLLTALFCLIAGASSLLALPQTIQNNTVWYASDNTEIHAQGGCVIKVGGTYYLYGADQGSGSGSLGVNWYASTDLVHWTSHGSTGITGLRPKVIYNDMTSRYVMIVEGSGTNAHNPILYATATNPQGPFTAIRQDNYVYGANMGDHSIYKDTDGQAYLIAVSDAGGVVNGNMRIIRLTPDYLGLDSVVCTLWTGVTSDKREAPCIVKRGSTYYLFTSLTAGWASSPTKYCTSTDLVNWTPRTLLTEVPAPSLAYPDNAFDTQNNLVIPVTGSAGTSFIYGGDRWSQKTGGSSGVGRNAWYPLSFDANGVPTLYGYLNWTIDADTGLWSAPSDAVDEASKSPMPADYTITASSDQGVVAGDSANDTITVDALDGFGDTVDLSVSGVPAGASVVWSASSLASSGTATVSIATTALTSPGVYPLTFVGSSGSTTRSAVVLLAVYAAAPTVPPAPDSVTGAATNARVALTWSTVASATRYNVKRATAGAGPYTTIASPLGSSYLDTGLTNGTAYYYVVSAVNALGESANSTPTVATPAAPAPTARAVSINFVGLGRNLGGSEGAGVISKPHWNSAVGPIGPGGSGLPLDDEMGVASGANVNWTNSYVVTTSITDPPGDAGMMAGYIECRGKNTTTSATVTGLASGVPYDIYVYFDTANGSVTRTATYTLSGPGLTTVSKDGIDTAGTNFSGTYVEANNSAGNYVKFSVTSATQFTVTALAKASGDSYYRAAINGLQIMPPQPSAPPTAPGGLSAVPGNQQVTLNWNANSQASSYNVKRATVTGGPYTTIASGLTTNSYVDGTAINGTTYYYVVSAVNVVGEGDNSMEVSATPSVQSIRSVLADAFVRDGTYAGTTNGTADNLTVKADGTSYTREAYVKLDVSGLASATSVVLQLTPTFVDTTNPTIAAEYVADDSWSETAITWNNKPAGSGTIAGTVTGFQVNQAASFDITALANAQAAGDGILTIHLYSTTPGGSTGVVFASKDNSAASLRPRLVITAAPAAPTTASAVANSSTQVTVSWDTISGATSYTVWRSAPGGGYEAVATGVTATTYVDGSITPGSSYTYAVTAVNIGGSSPYSPVVAVAVPRAPATVLLAGLDQTYDGTARAVTLTTDPAGVSATLTYDGAPDAPIYPGSYAVSATISDPRYVGAASGTLSITAGVTVTHAPVLNGLLGGSIQQLSGDAVTLNSSATVSGDLMVPGAPTVQINGTPTYAGTIDAVGGEDPSGYTITLNSGAVLRHVVRQCPPITLPNVPAPSSPTSTRDATLNNAGDSAGDFSDLRNLTLNSGVGPVSVPPGTYGSFTLNSQSALVFGTSGAPEPSVYVLQSLTLNSGSEVVVAGPVILVLANGSSINGSLNGSGSPDALAVNVASGELTINGGAVVHGQLAAPRSAVTINGTVVGPVACDRLTINGAGSLNGKP